MTLEQKRASMAFDHIRQIAEGDRTRYAGMAQKLPALIRSAGLCQALYFVKSRSKEPIDKDPFKKLLQHLAEQLTRTDPDIKDMESFCAEVRAAEVSRYVWLTRETLACVTWYSRLSRSEWGLVNPDLQDES